MCSIGRTWVVHKYLDIIVWVLGVLHIPNQLFFLALKMRFSASVIYVGIVHSHAENLFDSWKICWLLHWIISPPLPSPPHSCIILLRISQFDRFSAFPLKSDDTQWYPMHMKHNGASKTLRLLIDGVYPISDLIHCKLLWRRQQSGRTQPRSRPRPPRCHRTFPWVRWWDWLRRALRRPLWMAAVHDEWGGGCSPLLPLFSACVWVRLRE